MYHDVQVDWKNAFTMQGLKLSEKFHLRYFTLHIESLSDKAQQAADLLNIMAIKRSL